MTPIYKTPTSNLVDLTRDSDGRVYLLSRTEVILLHGNDGIIKRTWRTRHFKLTKIEFHRNTMIIATNSNKIILFDQPLEDIDHMITFETSSNVVDLFAGERLFYLCSDHSVWVVDGGGSSLVCPAEKNYGKIRACHNLGNDLVVVEEKRGVINLIWLNLATGRKARVRDAVFDGIRDIRVLGGSSGWPSLLGINNKNELEMFHNNGTDSFIKTTRNLPGNVMAISHEEIADRFALVLLNPDTSEYCSSIWSETYQAISSRHSLGFASSCDKLGVYFYSDCIYIVDNALAIAVPVVSCPQLRLSDLMSARVNTDDMLHFPFNGKKLSLLEESDLRKVNEDHLARLMATFLSNVSSEQLQNGFAMKSPFAHKEQDLYIINLLTSIPYSSAQMIPHLKRLVPLSDAMLLLKHFLSVIADSADPSQIGNAIDWINLIIDANVVKLRENKEYSDVLAELDSLVTSHMEINKNMINLGHVVQNSGRRGDARKDSSYSYKLINFL